MLIIRLSGLGDVIGTLPLLSALRAASPAPIVVGGRAVRDERQAHALGADGFASDVSAMAAFVETRRPRVS